MSTQSVHLVLLLCCLGSSSAAIGCGAASEDDPTPSMPGGGGAGMGGPPATGTSNFTGMIVESTNDRPIDNGSLALTVRALDNATGMPLAGKETMNDGNAGVAFADLPNPEVGFMIKGVPAMAIDTYTFNVESNAQGELLRVVAKSSVLTVKTVANVTLDPALGDLAGAIYWKNGSGVEEPVGCATVAIDDGQGEIRYFARNNLPTTNVALPSAPNLEVRTATNPLNGKFFITGTSLKRHTVTAMVNGQVIGSASLPVFAGTASTDGENAISLTDILVEGMSANPTPADCM
jgi:hypothetical protein